MDELVEPLELRGSVRPARPADDEQHGGRVVERGEGPHREVGALQRLDAPDEEERRTDRRDRARRAPTGVVPAPTAENISWSTPGGTISIAIALGAVEVDELLALVGRGREHEVGAADDLLLDPGARRRVVVDPGFGLDPGQRVERRDERQVELVLQPVADRAGDPVVRVQRVVADVLGGHVVERRLRPAGRSGRRARAWAPARGGPAARCTTRNPGSTSTTRRLARVIAAGEDVALDPGAGQRGGERPDVHVHPAAVAGARLGERGRVHAEDGEAAQRHTRRILTVGPPGPSARIRPRNRLRTRPGDHRRASRSGGQAPRSTASGISRSRWNDR